MSERMHHHPIPFLDAAGLLREDEDFTTSLREACVGQGVFHLCHSEVLFGEHRPPPIDDAIDATKAFFALPTSEKRRFERSKDRAAGFSDCELTVCEAPRRSANFSRPSLSLPPHLSRRNNFSTSKKCSVGIRTRSTLRLAPRCSLAGSLTPSLPHSLAPSLAPSLPRPDIAWVPRPDLPLDHELNVGIDGYNVFPDGSYHEKLLRYYQSAVKNVCNRLMRALCVAFDMDHEAVGI